MEFSIKDKLLSLIFPVVCIVYGLLEIRPYNVLYNVPVPVLAIIGGLITGGLTLLFKINTVEYLKVLTITTLITYLMWILIAVRIEMIDLYNIFMSIVLFGGLFLSTVKMPENAPARDRVLVFFENPVFYSLLNFLWGLLVDYMVKVGAVK